MRIECKILTPWPFLGSLYRAPVNCLAPLKYLNDTLCILIIDPICIRLGKISKSFENKLTDTESLHNGRDGSTIVIDV